MAWLLLEAALALALLVGAAAWVMLPARSNPPPGENAAETPAEKNNKKKGAVSEKTAPSEKADPKERREE